MPTPIVAILNMKGGVGKTTIAANIFELLFQSVGSTLLLDLDPQFNLTQMLLEPRMYNELRDNNETIASVFESPPPKGILDYARRQQPVPSLDDLAVHLEQHPRQATQELLLVPGDFRLIRYCMGLPSTRLATAEARFKQFIAEAAKEAKVICMDLNPSSSFLTKCALSVATHVVVPVRPDKYSVLGLGLLSDFIADLALPKPPQFAIVINYARRGAAITRSESDIRSHGTFGGQVFASRVYVSGYLAAKETWTGFAVDRLGYGMDRLLRELRAVERELMRFLRLRALR